MSLFGDGSEGHALRIYYSRPYKGAYVFIKGGVVTHASVELVFTLGWTKDKVVERAEKTGFSVIRQACMVMPREDWIAAPAHKPRKPRKKKEKV